MNSFSNLDMAVMAVASLVAGWTAITVALLLSKISSGLDGIRSELKNHNQILRDIHEIDKNEERGNINF